MTPVRARPPAAHRHMQTRGARARAQAGAKQQGSRRERRVCHARRRAASSTARQRSHSDVSALIQAANGSVGLLQTVNGSIALLQTANGSAFGSDCKRQSHEGRARCTWGRRQAVHARRRSAPPASRWPEWRSSSMKPLCAWSVARARARIAVSVPTACAHQRERVQLVFACAHRLRLCTLSARERPWTCVGVECARAPVEECARRRCPLLER